MSMLHSISAEGDTLREVYNKLVNIPDGSKIIIHDGIVTWFDDVNGTWIPIKIKRGLGEAPVDDIYMQGMPVHTSRATEKEIFETLASKPNAATYNYGFGPPLLPVIGGPNVGRRRSSSERRRTRRHRRRQKTSRASRHYRKHGH